MKQELIDRINVLARKQKAEGLNEEELKEQARLRKEYIDSIKQSLRANLNSISIVEEDGSVTDLGKKFGNVKDA